MHTYYACIYINLDGFCANCDEWKWARNFPIYHNNINFFCDKKSQDEFQKIKKFAQYFFACFEIPLFVNPLIDWPGVRSHYDNSANNRQRHSKTCLTTCAPMFIWEKCISVQKYASPAEWDKHQRAGRPLPRPDNTASTFLNSNTEIVHLSLLQCQLHPSKKFIRRTKMKEEKCWWKGKTNRFSF